MMQQKQQQQPLQPAFVLRGHAAAIHSLHFYRNNSRLISGDADGWLVVWDVVTRRPAAVWRAHTATVLGIETWHDDTILTDGRLVAWQLRPQDERHLSQQLIVADDNAELHHDRPAPWILHSLQVNALTFCAFAACTAPAHLLIALPSADEQSIVLQQLPEESIVKHLSTSSKDDPTGMPMALAISRAADKVTVGAAFESGKLILWHSLDDYKTWTVVLDQRPDTHPLLSLHITSDLSSAFTSGASATLAKLPLDGTNPAFAHTKHAGQQSLRVRSDGRILATAGWDGRGRVYSTKTLQELAVLKWHKDGCYALAFADVASSSTQQAHQAASSSLATTIALQHTATSGTVAQKRQSKAQTTHWLALGSKDSKISLWDVY